MSSAIATRATAIQYASNITSNI